MHQVDVNAENLILEQKGASVKIKYGRKSIVKGEFLVSARR
jgi:hypothetical protein